MKKKNIDYSTETLPCSDKPNIHILLRESTQLYLLIKWKKYSLFVFTAKFTESGFVFDRY